MQADYESGKIKSADDLKAALERNTQAVQAAAQAAGQSSGAGQPSGQTAASSPASPSAGEPAGLAPITTQIIPALAAAAPAVASILREAAERGPAPLLEGPVLDLGGGGRGPAEEAAEGRARAEAAGEVAGILPPLSAMRTALEEIAERAALAESAGGVPRRPGGAAVPAVVEGPELDLNAAPPPSGYPEPGGVLPPLADMARTPLVGEILPPLEELGAGLRDAADAGGGILPALERLRHELEEAADVLPSHAALGVEGPPPTPAGRAEPAPGEARAAPGAVLPEMKDIGLAPSGDVLPKLEDMGIPVERSVREKAGARRQEFVEQARAENLAGPGEVEAADPAVRAALAQIEATERAQQARAARQNIEEGPGFALPVEPAETPRVLAADPVVEKALRQREAAQERKAVQDAADEMEGVTPGAREMNKSLQGGARVAAQAGTGRLGQAVGGAADLAMGVATADPVQIAQGAIQVASASFGALADAANMASQGIAAVGHVAAQTASNDYMGAFNTYVGTASDALSKIPITGEAAAAALNLLAAPVNAFAEVTEAFIARGKQLQSFSPELTAANTTADLRSFLADMHEGTELGPDLARLTDAQSQFQTDLREMLLPIKEWLVGVLADVMETLATELKIVRGTVAAIKELMAIMVEFLNDVFGSGKIKDVPGLIASIDGRLKNAAEEALRDRMNSDMTTRILDLISDAEGLPGAGPAAPGAAGTRLGIPGILGGF